MINVLAVAIPWLMRTTRPCCLRAEQDVSVDTSPPCQQGDTSSAGIPLRERSSPTLKSRFMLKSMLASIVDLLLGGSACQVYRCKSRVFKQHELCILPGMRVI